MILTGVEKVALDFKKPTQRDLDVISREEARRLLEQGQFPPGNMGPKVEAALHFLDRGGMEVIITSIEMALPAIMGKTGTRIF